MVSSTNEQALEAAIELALTGMTTEAVRVPRSGKGDAGAERATRPCPAGVFVYGRAHLEACAAHAPEKCPRQEGCCPVSQAQG